jgi:hypothetical protein
MLWTCFGGIQNMRFILCTQSERRTTCFFDENWQAARLIGGQTAIGRQSQGIGRSSQTCRSRYPFASMVRPMPFWCKSPRERLGRQSSRTATACGDQSLGTICGADHRASGLVGGYSEGP